MAAQAVLRVHISVQKRSTGTMTPVRNTLRQPRHRTLQAPKDNLVLEFQRIGTTHKKYLFQKF